MKTLRFGFALLLAASIFSPPEASAQTIIGAKAGINIANVTFSGEGVSASADPCSTFSARERVNVLQIRLSMPGVHR